MSSTIIAASILSGLAGAGLTALVLKLLPDGSAQIMQGANVVATIPSLGVDNVHFDLKRYVTSNTTKRNVPDLSIPNFFSGSKIFSLAIRPNDQAKTDATIEIYSHDQGQLAYIPTGSMTDIDVINVPLPPEGLVFPSSKTIDFYIYGLGAQIAVTIYLLQGVLSQ